MPWTYPSMTCRATSSMRDTFASARGSSSDVTPLAGLACAVTVMGLRGGLVAGDFPEQPVDHLVAVHTSGLGAEGGEDAVAQHRVGHGGDVVGGDVDAAVENCPRLAGHDQVNA